MCLNGQDNSNFIFSFVIFNYVIVSYPKAMAPLQIIMPIHSPLGLALHKYSWMISSLLPVGRHSTADLVKHSKASTAGKHQIYCTSKSTMDAESWQKGQTTGKSSVMWLKDWALAGHAIKYIISSVGFFVRILQNCWIDPSFSWFISVDSAHTVGSSWDILLVFEYWVTYFYIFYFKLKLYFVLLHFAKVAPLSNFR